MQIKEIAIAKIRRPLPRVTDQEKVKALMQSIQEIGLQEPIDVLEVEGQYYGFWLFRTYCAKLLGKCQRSRART